MPAGQYVIHHSDCVLTVRERSGGNTTVIHLTQPTIRRDTPKTGQLVFNRYGDNYFLSQIWSPYSKDGRSLMESSREKEVAMNGGHVYTASGTYTITATATDDDGGGRVVTGSIVIKAVGLQGVDLVVGGTTAGDSILLTGSGAGIAVSINGVSQGLFHAAYRHDPSRDMAPDDYVQGLARLGIIGPRW